MKQSNQTLVVSHFWCPLNGSSFSYLTTPKSYKDQWISTPSKQICLTVSSKPMKTFCQICNWFGIIVNSIIWLEVRFTSWRKGWRKWVEGSFKSSSLNMECTLSPSLFPAWTSKFIPIGPPKEPFQIRIWMRRNP